jgi:hypothetical protein
MRTGYTAIVSTYHAARIIPYAPLLSVEAGWRSSNKMLSTFELNAAAL